MAALSPEQALEYAIAHHQAGRIAEAEAIYRQLLGLYPRHPDLLHLLGLVAAAHGRYTEAIELISQAIAGLPQNALFRCNLGVAFRRLGRLDEALIHLQNAVALDPNLADAHMNLGDVLHALGRFEESIASNHRALELRPNFAEAHNNLGNTLTKYRRWTEATECFQRALALNPRLPHAHNNLGHILLDTHRHDEAIAAFRRAIELDPNFDEPHGNLGLAWVDRGTPAASLQYFQELVATRPDFAHGHWNLALMLLRLGHFVEGWREYEWRWRDRGFTTPYRNLGIPVWDGSPAPGQTILINAEQGFGDSLQFIRYLPLVQQRSGARRVIFECPKELVRLLAQCGGWNAEIVAQQSWDGAPLDRHLPLLSLPLALGIAEPLQAPTPYLRAEEALRSKWRDLLGGRRLPRIGLNWAGNRQHQHDTHRSIEPERFLPLLQTPGAAFYNLHFGTESPPPALLEAGLIDLSSHVTNFAESAAFIAELDLVISVDTATVHLAGALGRPVWMLLPRVADWRWGIGCTDSLWYPTVRLFRQPARSGWEAVLPGVAEALRQFIATPAERR